MQDFEPLKPEHDGGGGSPRILGLFLHNFRTIYTKTLQSKIGHSFNSFLKVLTN